MPFPLVLLRVKKWGHSFGVTLPPMLRAELGISIGDVIAVRLHKPFGTFCVWRASDAIRLGEVPVGALPPLNPKELTRA
jgi:antitoxin component of MazEF toxin-antitoxin module